MGGLFVEQASCLLVRAGRMPTPQENLLFVEQASCLFSEKGATSQQKKFKKGVDKLRGVW
ncbi:MAG: hypothetical protein EAZ88_26230 [Oscillatoriales cyanobacterium]|nr:MAG: hypothetical protein EAZ88_26230 [Oscillatoriales cyanobacterium]